jgi:aminopeptidase
MYIPSPQILEKYAKVLVNFALNDGMGIKKDDVVYIVTQTPGLPLAKEIYRIILRSGGHPILNIQDDDFKLLHLQEGTDEQLSFFPSPYYKGLADSIDHYVRVLAEEDPLFLSKADPRKVILHSRSVKKFRDWIDEKEDAGKFTWTLCMYGTEGAAREAKMNIEEYWEQINRACFLHEVDPIKKWQDVLASMHAILQQLNDLPIVKLHLEADQTDLWVGLGEHRKWLGGRGRNIPSFEIFTSPDWREVEGKVFFDLPLYRYGNIIKDIKLEIKNGIITSAKAAENEKLLQEMLSQKNADKIGEFSLTDKRFSKINKFMANTLFDENFGGNYGNTHLAVGKAYHDACSLNTAEVTSEEFEKLGYNDSPEHTDIIATSDRKVTAVLKDGSRKLIYEGGEFQL